MESSNIKNFVSQILKDLGENESDPDLNQTPERVMQAYKILFSGYTKNAKDVLKVKPASYYENDIILFDKINFVSMCKHHIMPFYGNIQIAYIPQDHIIGFGSLQELVKVFTGRLQIQEQLISQIGNAISESSLNPKGVFIKIEALHSCVFAKGDSNSPASLKNIFTGGDFKKPENLEKLQIILK